MLNIIQGLRRDSLTSMDQLTFDKYDKDGDGVISASEYNNFVQVAGVNKVQGKRPEKTENKGFDLEQFDPQGAINFESNGGFNARKLNIIA